MADPADYGYAVSRLRAMENRLLDQGVFQRLLDSEDLPSALKVMSETAYGKWFLEQQGEDNSTRQNQSSSMSIPKQNNLFPILAFT